LILTARVPLSTCKTTAPPRKPDQAAASISDPVDFTMNSSSVWQTIAAGKRPCADALISAFRGVICVFDPAIRITAGHPLGHRPDVESIAV